MLLWNSNNYNNVSDIDDVGICGKEFGVGVNLVLFFLDADGGTANPVNVNYIAPGSDQPYAFTFRADVFYSGKISSIKAASDKDDVVVKSSENGCQAQVSDSYRVTVLPRWITVCVQLDDHLVKCSSN